jgi:hypothetical protein
VTVGGQLLARVEGLTLAFGDLHEAENAGRAAEPAASNGTAAATNGHHAPLRPASDPETVASF